MEEKLNSVLQRVLRLCKENQEFDIALRKALKIESSASLSANDGTKLKRIEQYLGLDYAVDNQNSLIDYSFVIDNEVRKMLECDNR